MNQQQFDRDNLGEGLEGEPYQDWRGNPMQKLFDNASRQRSEKSYLHQDSFDDEVTDIETDREIRRIRKTNR